MKTFVILIHEFIDSIRSILSKRSDNKFETIIISSITKSILKLNTKNNYNFEK